MKILFPGVGRRVELMQNFRAAAEKLGIDLILYGADISNSAPALAFCDKTVIVPKIKEASYLPTLIDICENEQIDAVIPMIDTDLQLLADNKEKFGETLVFVSKPEKIALCRDKRYTAEYFETVGLKSPRPVESIKDYNGGFPAFIKPRDGSSSINAYKVNNEEELIIYGNQIPNFIIQPFIEGTEYTVDVFCDYNGNPVFITPRIRLAVRAGEVLKSEIAQDGRIISEIMELIKDYKPCGQITVQLIRDDKTGEDWYIEINPRFGGGAPMSIRAGADSAEMILRILQGEHLEYIPFAAENGAIFSRFDQSIRVNG